jgi:hypothetical protein
MVDTPSRRYRWLYVLSTVAAFYTSLLTIMLVPVPLLAMWLFGRRPLRPLRQSLAPVRGALAPVGVVAVLALPLAAIAADHGSAQIAWIPRPHPGELWSTALTMMSTSSAGGVATTARYTSVWGAALLAACVAGVVRHARRQRSSGSDGTNGMVALAALWLAVPPVLTFLVSQFTATHFYLDRYFTVCLPAAALLVALAVDALRPSWAVWGVCAVVVALRFTAIPSTYGIPVDGSNWTPYVLDHARPGDCITFPAQSPETDGLTSDIAYYAARHGDGARLPTPILPSFDWHAALNASFTTPSFEQSSLTSAAVHCKRIWFVLGEGSQDFDVDTRIYYYASNHWKQHSVKLFPGLGFQVFVRAAGGPGAGPGPAPAPAPS